MVKLFKNMFKNNKEEQVAKSDDLQAQAVAENAPVIEKKPKHGEDGVCCGGCS